MVLISHSKIKVISSETKSKQKSRTVGGKFKYILIFFLVTLGLFGGIGSRFAYLQLVKGEEYRQKAENNRTRIIPKSPVRGNMFDRFGRVMAATRLSHSIYVWPTAAKKPTWPKTRWYLSQILKIEEREIQEKVDLSSKNSTTLIRIARGLNFNDVTAIEEYRHLLHGVEVDAETVRFYPHGELAAHVLGYTGELNPQQLQERKHLGYRLGDFFGKLGAEAAFESSLRGEWGGLKLEVDGSGRMLRILGQEPALAGNDLTLTLDVDVQRAAEKALGERKGAVVAINPNDGSVLAMASYPRFDPNIFSSRFTPDIWQQLTAKGDPFINRGLRGFPPASTFKIVTATSGMESGKYPSGTVLPTYAYLNVGGTLFGEWNRAGFGPMNYIRSMAWSSNTFYGQVGRGVGGETLIDWARKFGFGSKTGIELPEETPGLIADDAWKRKRFNWGWSDGDSVNMSIGQGFTLATPLQVAVMFAVVANGGYRIQPHLLDDNGASLEKRVSLNLKPTTISTLRQGLRSVVTSGTGRALSVDYLPPAAGKSGTAEAPPGKSHTWFGGFAPYDHPEIVVVAFVEHSGGGGGSTAGPIVRDVMAEYFNSQKKNND